MLVQHLTVAKGYADEVIFTGVFIFICLKESASGKFATQETTP